MKKYFLGFLVTVFFVGGILAWQSLYFNRIAAHIILLSDKQAASVAAIVNSPFYYTFKVDGVLDEAGKMDDSSSPYWWLNSGGQFYLKDGIGKTVQRELAKFNKWRLTYAASNPIDTDNGYHPQNIFRLVTRSKWRNFSQEASFQNVKLNMSTSTNRNASNGILLVNRYQDGNNLYYTGIRVDGAAVIKKKIKGVYYTMAYKPFYKADTLYNRDTNPNLIPTLKWIGLKSEVKTNSDNTVSIKLFIDKDKTGNWVLVAEAKDDGKNYGGVPILNEGYAGIRTDFMDVLFDDYRIVKI
ncbi:MAG: hypothetical protein Q7S11_01320 [bacterium]|nr:hypothetical protein [bacterium]